MQEHERTYGPIDSLKVGATLKKLLAKTKIEKETLDTDEEMSEDWDEIDDDDEDPEPSRKKIRKDCDQQKKQRRCKKCKKVEGHNSRTPLEQGMKFWR